MTYWQGPVVPEVGELACGSFGSCYGWKSKDWPCMGAGVLDVYVLGWFGY